MVADRVEAAAWLVAMLVVLIPAAFLVAAFGYSTWHGTVLIALVGSYAFALAFGSRRAV